MALTTPTVADINANIISQLEAALGQTIPILPKAFARVLAKILAAVFVLLYKYAGFIFLQLFVQYASFDETTINGKVVRPLVEWGRLVGIGDPVPATRAELTVTVIVEEEIDDLAAGSKLLRKSTGVVYSVVAAVPLVGATVTPTIQAVADDQGNLGAGAIGNLEVGDELEFANPLAYVSKTVTVASVINTASDAETEDAYRSRVLQRFQAKPQGGAEADYRAWGEEVDGIVSVFPYAGDNPGEVDLFAEATVASSGSEDGIPTSDQLAAVLTAVQYDEEGVPNRAPINHAINVLPITRVQLGATITGLVVDDPTTVQDDIDAALDEYFRSLEPYIVGLSVPPRKDRALVADVGGVVSDVVRAANGTFGTITMTLNGGTVISYTLEHGEKARLVSSGATFS